MRADNSNHMQKLNVYFDNRLVGTLALTDKKNIAFMYDDVWLENGFSISPFSLQLEKKVFLPSKPYFGGLFGVFADSLPDAWGNILLNRMLKKQGIEPGSLNPLDRLAIVGESGMGALTYRPVRELLSDEANLSIDELAEQCRQVLHSENPDNLDELYRLGGTSGGARPKVLMQIEKEDWMIKFPAHVDGKDAGLMEFEYAKCAEKCGITVSEARLFPSENCSGYFGTKRFDRIKGLGGTKERRVHMITTAALLELDFEQPCLDYHDLMKLTKILTGEYRNDVEEMYRRMCFNIFAHNRDDHSKNFSYLYKEDEQVWRLSPAYDMTYSNTYYGEHTTSVDGNGVNPGKKELIAVGLKAGLKKNWCEACADSIEACVYQYLKKYV